MALPLVVLHGRKQMTYKVFTRKWWKDNPSWPNGLEPDSTAKKTTLYTGVETEAEARALCREWNNEHKPGRYSRKAEYTEE
jgi:hypothetical protein